MIINYLIDPLIQKRDKQIAFYQYDATAEMRNRFAMLSAFISKLEDPYNCTTTIFDLSKGRYSIHRSVFNEVLDRPAMYASILDNRNMINNVTHPDELYFCLETEEIILSQLLTLSFPEYPDFKAIFSRRLLEKDGRYVTYVHHVTVLQCNDDNKPWLLKIVTERMPDLVLPTFRRIIIPGHHYNEKHSYSKYLQSHRFSKRRAEIILLLKKKKTQCEIARHLNIATSSVNSQYKKIEEIVRVDSIHKVSILAHLFDFL